MTRLRNPNQTQDFSLWAVLEKNLISREELPSVLYERLGEPKSELQQNLIQEIVKRINSYYFTKASEVNYTIYSVVGSVTEIIQKQRKEGPRKGQIFYVLVLSTKDKLHAYQETLPKDKFSQIANLGLLGQNLVFQYKKQFFNKEILGWYSAGETKRN